MARPLPILTEAEYLAFERASSERHEFIDGHMFAVGGPTVARQGATFEHNSVVTNLVVELHEPSSGWAAASCRQR
jgi:hypothetical protein